MVELEYACALCGHEDSYCISADPYDGKIDHTMTKVGETFDLSDYCGHGGCKSMTATCRGYH